MDESALSFYSFGARIGYQIVLWPIVVAGTLGNLSVLWRVTFSLGTNSPLKPTYRGALVSLAASDLLFLASSGLNSLSNFMRPNIIWALPDWACSLIPCLQTMAALSSSLTLAAVASERFRATRPKYPPPTGPRWPMVVLLYLSIWLISVAVSYPVFGLYATNSLIVITGSTYYRASLCVTLDRDKTGLVYVILYIVIFLPLAVVFLGVHLLLALKISGRRERGNKGNLAAMSSNSQLTETSTATTSAATVSPISQRRSVHSSPLPHRKQRTVKVLLALILVFIVCRLPMWTFAVVKLHVALSGRYWWHVQASVSVLSLLNTAINPFLYAFINETLSTITWIRSWCAKTNDANVTTVGHENLPSHVASIKVPRGPYAP